MFIALTESFESDDPRPGIYNVDKIESILNEGEALALWGQSHEAPSAVVKGKRRVIFLAWIKAGMPIIPDVPGGLLMTLERRAWEAKSAEPATKAGTKPVESKQLRSGEPCPQNSEHKPIERRAGGLYCDECEMYFPDEGYTPQTNQSIFKVPASLLSADDGFCSVGGLAADLGLYTVTAEPATKAETQPPDTASEDEIMGREFDTLQPGDVIENVMGERFTVTEISNGSSIRKGTIRIRHVLHKDDYPSSECRRDRYVKYNWRKVIPNKSVEPTQPPLREPKPFPACPKCDDGTVSIGGETGSYRYFCQRCHADLGDVPPVAPLQWVDWKEGTKIKDGLYPVVVGVDTWASMRTFRDGEWRWSDGMPCGPYNQPSRYLPIPLPAPFVKQ